MIGEALGPYRIESELGSGGMGKVYHAALAETLESRGKAADTDPETLDGALCVDICEHCLKGARGEAALRCLGAAQAHLTKGYLHAQVVALGERALAVPDLLTGLERAQALLRLGAAADLLGRRECQEECAREAERLAEEGGDAAVRAKAALALGNVLWRTSRNEEAEAAFRRAIEIAIAEGDQKAEAAATGALGSVLWSQGRLPDAKDHYERQLALCREIGHRQGEAIALHNLGSVHREEGEPARAEESLSSSLGLSEEIGFRHAAAATHWMLGSLRAAAGDGAGGRSSLEAARDRAAEIGVPGYEVLALCELALLPGGDGSDALAAFTAHEERLGAEERRAARLLLWKATGDRMHLEAAKQLLDEVLAQVPEEYHESMRQNLRVNREILAACKEQGIG